MSDPKDTSFPDEAHLGASPTLPLKSGGKGAKATGSSTDAGSSGGGGRRRRGGGALLVVGLVVVVVLAFTPVLRGAFVKTPRDRIGISYGGGPIEGSHFQKIVEPGSALMFNGIFDQLYLYPSDQRSYIISAGPESTEGAPDYVTAPTSDRVQVQFQVALYFKLNTNPAELRQFHEEIGLRYQAYGGSGWSRAIQEIFQPQVESAIQEEARRSTVADLFGDADRLAELQEAVQGRLSQRLEQSLGGRFFCSPSFRTGGECGDLSFVIKRLDVPENVAKAFEGNRTSEIAIQTRENEVEQRRLEAEGIDALADALASSGDQYTLLKAIESGQINFWVLPESGGVTLQAPEAPAGDAGN